MSSGTSLPGDFTPIPQVLEAHARQAFVARSIKILDVLESGPGGGGAIERMNDPGFSGGGQYGEVPTLVQSIAANRRDITSTSALTAQKLTGVNNNGVVLNRRSDLMSFADTSYIGGFTREDLSAECGKQIGEKMLDDVLSILIAAMRGAVEAVGSSANVYSVWSATVRTTLDPDVIDGGRVLLGDRSDILNYILTNSYSNRDLRGAAKVIAIQNVAGEALQGADNRAQWGLSKAIRDDANLTASDAGFDKYYTLLLGAGAIKYGFVKPIEIETIRYLSNENKATLLRADWDLFVQVQAMQYNRSAGGANPTVTALATSSNWTDNTSSNKEVPMIELVHNYSGN